MTIDPKDIRTAAEANVAKAPREVPAYLHGNLELTRYWEQQQDRIDAEVARLELAAIRAATTAPPAAVTPPVHASAPTMQDRFDANVAATLGIEAPPVRGTAPVTVTQASFDARMAELLGTVKP